MTATAAAQDVAGSGSTFAFPILSKWIEAYNRLQGTAITFEPIGSARGIAEVSTGTVDFGITEAPFVDAQLLRDGLMQFPLVIGAIVPVVNLDGLSPQTLHLTGAVLADIYRGSIKRWNDPAIAALNPGLTLPNKAIFPIYRSDGSGTSYNWADFLSRNSTVWEAQVGAGTSVSWPVGSGGKGNRGVADNVARVKGAIGYVEYSYALDHRLNFALVNNQAGAYVAPSAESFMAAVSGVDWLAQPDFSVLLTGTKQPGAYPLMATSFVVTRRYPGDPDRAARMMAFFQWVLKHGQDPATALGYLPLPPALVTQVEAYWHTPPASGTVTTAEGPVQ